MDPSGAGLILSVIRTPFWVRTSGIVETGVPVTEQLLLDLRAQAADVLIVQDVEFRDEPPLCNTEIRHLLVLGACADDLGDTLPSLESNFCIDQFRGGNAKEGGEALMDQDRCFRGSGRRRWP